MQTDSTDNPNVVGLKQWLEDWPEKRYFTAEEVYDLYMYEKYLVNLLSDVGLTYRGESVKYQTRMTLLVVKVSSKDGPMVCFINGRTSLECKGIFIEKLAIEGVEWRPDRYG